MSLSDLTDFGLEHDQEVRFRMRPGGKWRPGRVRGVHPDGSLSVLDQDRGYARALLPTAVEIETKTNGPRGGTHWVPVGGRT